MKTLILVRHATAVDKSGGLPDFERPLVKKGRKDARLTARHLAAAMPPPDLMISSFADRALETAHIFAGIFKYPPRKIVLKDSFYDASGTEVLQDEIRALPDTCRSAMLFGHDPAFSHLAAHFVPDFKEAMPKSGAVGLEFKTGNWAAIQGGAGRLIFFVSPDRLKQERKEILEGLESRIGRSVERILAGMDRTGAAAIQKDIRKAARRIAGEFLKNAKDVRPR